MTHRSYAMLIPAALLAIALPWFSADFNDLFMVQDRHATTEFFRASI